MTLRTIRAGAAVLGGASLLAVAGCGGGSAPATPSASGQGTQSTSGQSAPPQRGAGGIFSQANLSALAKDLGVSTARLQQAIAAARPAGAPNGTPPGAGQGSGRPPAGAGGRGGQLAAGLAEQLGLSTDKVQQALDKVMPRRTQGSAPQAASSSSTQN
jgi:hypothetical protein